MRPSPAPEKQSSEDLRLKAIAEKFKLRTFKDDDGRTVLHGRKFSIRLLDIEHISKAWLYGKDIAIHCSTKTGKKLARELQGEILVDGDDGIIIRVPFSKIKQLIKLAGLVRKRRELSEEKKEELRVRVAQAREKKRKNQSSK